MTRRPPVEGLLVVRVERIECGLKLGRELERIEIAGLARALARQAAPALLQDLPKVAVDRHVARRQVVVDGHARQFDDAAFDRVEQREVAHDPGKERALAIAGAGKEERRRRQIVDAGNPDLALQGFDAGNPEPRRLVVLGRLVLLFASGRFFSLTRRALAIAVVRLVVDDDDILQRQEARRRRAQASRPRFRVVIGGSPRPCNRARPTLETSMISRFRNA